MKFEFEKLIVYQKAVDFADSIYKLSKNFPKEELFGITTQIRRASLSISLNIAEGYGRFYYQDNVRFCYIARGSLDETLSHLSFAFEMKFILEESYKSLQQEGDEIDKMLNGYINFLKQSKRGLNEPGANLVIREDPVSYLPSLPDSQSPNS